MAGSERPNPPPAWGGPILGVYPNGEQSDFDLARQLLRPGDPLPGKPYVFDRFDVSERPVEDGRYMVIGIFREAEAETAGWK